MAFTQEQVLAIESQGKTLVSASAGSGKTTVMIEKIIRLIRSGVGVDEILAVTFTKKAAAQMKEKLSKALIEEINAPDVTEERRSALKKQLSEVPSADVSTIHSFCAKLLRRNFYAAGVDNAFRVISGDDADGTLLKNEALDELLEEGYEEKEELFAHLLSVYWRKKSDNVLRRIFLSVYDKLRARADYREYLMKSKEYSAQTFEDICVTLKAKLDEKCEYYRQLVEDERAHFVGMEKSAQLSICDELLALLEETLACKDYFSACAVKKPARFTSNTGVKKLSPELALHAERIVFLKGRIVKFFEDELEETGTKAEELEKFLCSAQTASALAEYLLRFDDKYSRLKAERGVLDYNDLEHKTFALLGMEEIAASVREKYRYVFVDEYQDVNPVQEALISRIGGENVFLVGDVKQAIYGFRGSKSKFFVEKQKEFAEGVGNNLYMSRNFRSSDKVLDAVNAQFVLAMTPRVCAVDYARGSYMEKGGRYALNDGNVEVHFVGEEKKSPSAEGRGVYSVRAETGKKTASASSMAKMIRQIIQTEVGKEFFDPDEGRVRPVRYSDIAVLSRKMKGQIVRTVEALSAEGVPVTAATSVNVCEFTEIKALMDLLSLIDNAEQDIPLCSVLLSAVGNFTADELAEIRLTYKEEKFFRNACKRYATEQTNLLAYKMGKFFAYFQEIRILSRVLDAGELLNRVMTDTRMEAEVLSRANGFMALKRIRRFIEESFIPEPLSVHAFLDRLRDLDYTVKYSENGGDDAVKVMTMHSSKGLEFPIVILDNLSAPLNGVDKDEVYVEEGYGLAPYAFDSETMTKGTTLLRRLHENREAESSISDSLNLYYVALTRAKYGLHMIFESPSVMADVKYARSFAEFTDFSVWEEYFANEEIFDVPKQDRSALVFRPDEEFAREIMRSFHWKYGHGGYENLPVKSSATRLLPDFASDFEAETPYIEEEKEETNKEVGLAYHAFLEDFDFSLLLNEKGERISVSALFDLVTECLQRGNEAGRYALNLLSVEKLVEILSNPVFEELKEKRLLKEQKFLVSLPVKDTYAKKENAEPAWRKDTGENMIFQGAIDLLALSDDSALIIDYKFSKGSAEYLHQHYRPQLDLYRQTVAKILQIPLEKIKCVIVNIYRGFQVEVE